MGITTGTQQIACGGFIPNINHAPKKDKLIILEQ